MTAHPMTDKSFEAEYDAQTLSDAEVIKANKPRLGKAKKAAVTLAKKKQAEAVAMKKVTRRPVLKSRPAPKSHKKRT